MLNLRDKEGRRVFYELIAKARLTGALATPVLSQHTEEVLTSVVGLS